MIHSIAGEPAEEYREISYIGPNSGIETYANGSLRINVVNKVHEGYYLCQANNGIGAGLSKLIRLIVNGK